MSTRCSTWCPKASHWCTSSGARLPGSLAACWTLRPYDADSGVVKRSDRLPLPFVEVRAVAVVDAVGHSQQLLLAGGHACEPFFAEAVVGIALEA